MTHTKLGRRALLLAVVVVVTGLAAFIGGMFFKGRLDADEGPEIMAELIAQEIESISEYAALEYRYTNVGKFEDQIDFYGWNVPFTTKSFIITYDGTIKLGIDAGKIEISIAGQEILVKLPEIEILSHEIEENSLEVLDQTKNIFNPLTIEDFAGFAADQKAETEEKAKEKGIYAEARKRAEDQLGAFIGSLPGIRGEYAVVFVG